MKSPAELTRKQLENIVSRIRNILWRDPITGEFDPDRSWHVETLEWVSGVVEDAGLKPDPVRPASTTADEKSASRLRCPQCGERGDLLVRIDSLARLARDDRSGVLSLDLEDKTPSDYEWRAFHCGRCGFESARNDFEEPAVVAMRSALDAFIRTIEATGGCVRPGRADVGLPDEDGIEFDDDLPVPAGDESWPDLADAYILACRALGRQPLVRGADAETIAGDGEDAGET
jgi:hypothetical protein